MIDTISKVQKNENQNKYYFSWKEFMKSVEIIANYLKNKNVDIIYGIPRGGMPLAVTLSHKCNIQLCTNIEELTNQNILFVDDICDSGNTLKKYKEYFSNALFITIHKRYNSTIIPDFFVNEIKNDDWVIYSWEENFNACDCGCGKLAKNNNKYIHGHQWKASKIFKDTIRTSNDGRFKFSKEYNLEQNKSKTGKNAVN